jgi:hypothetical protein
MLPVRKKTEMRAIMEHLDGGFRHVWWSAVETAPDLIRETKSQEIPSTVNSQVAAGPKE